MSSIRASRTCNSCQILDKTKRSQDGSVGDSFGYCTKNGVFVHKQLVCDDYQPKSRVVGYLERMAQKAIKT